MTIGELIEKLKREIFQENSDDKFIQLCRTREEGLKEYIEICRIIIEQHIEKPGLDPSNLSFWKKEKIKHNMQNLVKYTEELANELDREKIEDYCKNASKRFLFSSPFEPDFIFLIHNSYYGSVITDILWAKEITITEAMDISGGKLDLEELGKKLPTKIKEIEKKIIPYINHSERYYRHFETLNEALKCFEKKFYRACNLLLMTSIEGIVRDLADFLNIKQCLDLNLNSGKYNSLDALLRHGGWKDDYEIGETELSLIMGENLTKNERINSFNGDIFRKKKINLKTRLDFLRRRFKDDRDLILHGVEHNYSTKWNLFLNFSALSHVYEVIYYYDDLYE